MIKIPIQISFDTFDPISHWSSSIPSTSIFSLNHCVNLFDQNGYHLTPIEQLYAEENGYPLNIRRHETVIRKSWLTSDDVTTGPHINHSDLFERKAYDGSALEQLKYHATNNNLLWKVIKMKPKWGIDISIDHVDDEGNVFEVFHYEWDSFDYELIHEKKLEIETFVLKQDWDDVAKRLWQLKDDWFYLDFFEQTAWRTNYFGLSPEKFKNVIWNN